MLRSDRSEKMLPIMLTPDIEMVEVDVQPFTVSVQFVHVPMLTSDAAEVFTSSSIKISLAAIAEVALVMMIDGTSHPLRKKRFPRSVESALVVSSMRPLRTSFEASKSIVPPDSTTLRASPFAFGVVRRFLRKRRTPPVDTIASATLKLLTTVATVLEGTPNVLLSKYRTESFRDPVA